MVECKKSGIPSGRSRIGRGGTTSRSLFSFRFLLIAPIIPAEVSGRQGPPSGFSQSVL